MYLRTRPARPRACSPGWGLVDAQQRVLEAELGGPSRRGTPSSALGRSGFLPTACHPSSLLCEPRVVLSTLTACSWARTQACGSEPESQHDFNIPTEVHVEQATSTQPSPGSALDDPAHLETHPEGLGSTSTSSSSRSCIRFN